MSKNKVDLKEYNRAKQIVEHTEKDYIKKIENIYQVIHSVFNKCHNSGTFEQVVKNTEYECFVDLSIRSLKKTSTFVNIDEDSIAISQPAERHSKYSSPHIKNRQVITISQQLLSRSDRDHASIIRKKIRQYNNYFKECERKSAASRITQLQKEVKEKEQEIEQLSQTIQKIHTEQIEKEKKVHDKLAALRMKKQEGDQQ